MTRTNKVKTVDSLITAKSGDPKVYLLRNGNKHWVTNEETLVNLGFNWDDVKRISLKEIQAIPTLEPLTSITQKIYETKDEIYCIEKMWSDDFACGAVGWVIGKKQPIKSLKIKIDGQDKTINNWVARPDILDHFSNNSDYVVQEKCGFAISINRKLEHMIEFKASTGDTDVVSYKATQRINSVGFITNKNLEKQFRDLVNKKKLSVLEVGSRISPGGENKRVHFKNAKKYVGIDYIDGETVDIVGDAHKLSSLVNEKFDALYSDSVLEHLAMPWKAVIEMNKVLKKGGYVIHSAPSNWIPHDMPWDFWRFSDASMRVLFSKPFGFRVIDVEYTSPVKIHIDSDIDDSYSSYATSPAYGFVFVLAQKVSNINNRKIRFNYDLQDVVGQDSSYPDWKS